MTIAGKALHESHRQQTAKELKPLKLEMVVDTSAVDAALSGFVDAIKLADRVDENGRRLTAVDELIDETIAGDARLAILAATGGAAVSAAWEAVARDLARQVINCETEIAELDEELEEQYEEGIDAITGSRDLLANQVNELASRLHDEEQAHCATYVEAVRLAEELAGWQNSSHAEYRRSTAARRLEQYRNEHTP